MKLNTFSGNSGSLSGRVVLLVMMLVVTGWSGPEARAQALSGQSDTPRRCAARGRSRFHRTATRTSRPAPITKGR